MKKKYILSALTSLFLANSLTAQMPEFKGKPIAEIFTDFHVNLNDTSRTTGFGLNRAYFGYRFLPASDFTATIILNIGSPEDLPNASVHRRYAYVREASVAYAKDGLHVSFGITSARHFDYQQKFWGKRYVANTFQALNLYGVVADLGVVADYKFSDLLSADVSVMNGEGYSELQLDNGVKTSAGITITPSNKLAIRFYNDITKQYGIWQYTIMTFAGYRNDRLTFGAEFNYKTNLDLHQGDNAWGISTTGAYSLTSKYEVFGRYDYSASVEHPEEDNHWNYLRDGSLVIGGVQRTFNDNFRIALNYQENIPYDADKSSSGYIYLSAAFKF